MTTQWAHLFGARIRLGLSLVILLAVNSMSICSLLGSSLERQISCAAFRRDLYGKAQLLHQTDCLPRINDSTWKLSSTCAMEGFCVPTVSTGIGAHPSG